MANFGPLPIWYTSIEYKGCQLTMKQKAKKAVLLKRKHFFGKICEMMEPSIELNQEEHHNYFFLNIFVSSLCCCEIFLKMVCTCWKIPNVLTLFFTCLSFHMSQYS